MTSLENKYKLKICLFSGHPARIQMSSSCGQHLTYNNSPCEMLALWNPTKVGANQFHRASNPEASGLFHRVNI
jgi:hypothetical protein